MQQQLSIFCQHIDFKKLGAAQKSALNLLSDGQPHTTMEIIKAGGASGMRRLRELRELGFNIIGEAIKNSNQWRYHLVG